MKLRAGALLCLAAAGLTAVAGRSSAAVHHQLRVVLDPTGNRIAVEDLVTLSEPPSAGEGATLHFLLHRGLEARSPAAEVTVERVAEAPLPEHFGLEGGQEPPATVATDLYRVQLPPGVERFAMTYAGSVHHDLSEEKSYARGFQQTAGMVSEQGVYLSGATYWYPWLGPDAVTFTLETQLPAGWDAVSQGRRTLHERDPVRTRVRWEEAAPQDEIYLLAGRYHEYRESGGSVAVQVFLRTPDEALAGKYLEVGGQYLKMYSDLLGPYPYSKFALVENFWETGYGMPSFSLLGPQVIRFPFILHSSYPHEILHNWWGNGVYVEWDEGNWCEGLTAYLADHLIQEGRGTGAEYRQTTLQKYTDYAAKGRDTALADFRGRHSSASEAVGYGKALMFYHMLRQRLGDEGFIDGLRTFYREQRFRAATFADLRAALEAATGQDLGREFEQWVQGVGAPELHLAAAAAHPAGAGWVLELRLEQAQEGAAYELRVPVAVTLEGRQEAEWHLVEMPERERTQRLELSARPLRVDVDPLFDLFRKLDPAETPPALSGSFGAEQVLVLLPATAPPELLAGYRQLAESWASSQPGEWEIRADDELESLPADRAVWLCGWENRFLTALADGLVLYDAALTGDGVRFSRAEVPRVGHTSVAVVRHPARGDLNLTWVATDSPAALPGLGRKLPHYHKYSYLGFEGDEPANIVKGRWAAVDSPLSALLPAAGKPEETVAMGKLPGRRPLAELPPVFSARRMGGTVRRLTAPELEGRGFGSAGLTAAAEFIAAEFRAAGLAPGGEGGGYFRSWSSAGGEAGGEVVLRNVVGVIPGTRPEWAAQSVVLGAHYDHLGRGWPEAREGTRGQVHPGADDNASGIAVLLELARALGSGWRPERAVVLVAFAGEEAGRLGSRQYLRDQGPYPGTEAIGMVNLDTVGRLGQGKLLVLGTGSAREWVHIFRGAGFVTGVPLEPVAKDVGGSDQVSFLEAGVPAVQLFSGPHLDYHRPSDTADKVDLEGLVKVAAVVKEVVEYLAGREQPLASTLESSTKGSVGTAATGPRKASLGTVPDFADAGDGVLLEGVVPDSPADRAGLQKGDRVVGVGDHPVRSLADLSAALKALQPGQVVSVTFRRDGSERTAEAVLETR